MAKLLAVNFIKTKQGKKLRIFNLPGDAIF
jgi:hypothetical protein